MKSRPAFTLIELIIAMVIVGILASIANRSVRELVERARIVRAVSEIRTIGTQLAVYFAAHNAYPSTLTEAGIGAMRDPWNRPYVYMLITASNMGQVRKDRFLVPLNTDYDLYSIGADGVSFPPLTAKESRDDIVRVQDGGFIGLARDF